MILGKEHFVRITYGGDTTVTLPKKDIKPMHTYSVKNNSPSPDSKIKVYGVYRGRRVIKPNEAIVYACIKGHWREIK